MRWGLPGCSAQVSEHLFLGPREAGLHDPHQRAGVQELRHTRVQLLALGIGEAGLGGGMGRQRDPQGDEIIILKDGKKRGEILVPQGGDAE